MPEVTIHHCILRVVRRGGWAWGADPQKLLQGAVKALPELLARELAALWPEDAECEIAAPVRISIPIRPGDLLEMSAALIESTTPRQSSPAPAVSACIARAVQAAFEPQPSIAIAANPKSPPQAIEDESRDEAAIDLEALSGSAVAQLLVAWQLSGALALRLAGFSLAALDAWYRSLIAGGAKFVNPETVNSETMAELIERAVYGPDVRSLPRAAILRRRIIALSEAMARFKLRPDDPGLLAALERALPLPEQSEGEPIYSASPAAVESAAQPRDLPRRLKPQLKEASPAPPRQPLAGPPGRGMVDCRVASALPFLLLGPLSRMGYLQALAATLEAADCAGDAPLFAAALAHKVLAPPARGWRREPAVTAAATAFAGLEEPVAEPALAGFTRRFAAQLSPLDALISGSLIEGHNLEQPLLLCRAGTGLLLMDVEGVFPIKWASDASGMRDALIRLDSSIILMPKDVAEVELLGWMNDAGFRFITDAPPARGESWRPLRRPPSEGWWTNDAMTGESALVRMARAMQAAAEDAETLWQSLAVQRPCVFLPEPTDGEAAFDRHVTLAAAAALGTMAWELWRERETTAPHLALERFGDLDARISYSRRAVCAGLPLGRRFQDLRDHGLLRDVNDVPWLNGRTLTFSVA